MNDLRKCMLPFLSVRRDMDFNEVLDFPGRLMWGPLDSMAPRRGIAKDMALAAARATFCASLAQKTQRSVLTFALHIPVPLRYRVTFSLLAAYLYLILQNRSRPCRLPKTTELLRIVF